MTGVNRNAFLGPGWGVDTGVGIRVAVEVGVGVTGGLVGVGVDVGMAVAVAVVVGALVGVAGRVGVFVGVAAWETTVAVGVAVGLMVVMGVGGMEVGVGEDEAAEGWVAVGVSEPMGVAASPPQASSKERVSRSAEMITQGLKSNLLDLQS